MRLKYAAVQRFDGRQSLVALPLAVGRGGRWQHAATLRVFAGARLVYAYGRNDSGSWVLMSRSKDGDLLNIKS